MNFVADAGKQMLESSSSVSEVQERLRRFLPIVGLDGCSLDSNLSSIILSYWRQEWPAPLTTMREVNVSQPRLERLAGAEALLERIEQGKIDLPAAFERLRKLERSPGLRPRYTRLAMLASVLGWVVFLDGLTLPTVLVALLATLLTFPVGSLVSWLRLPSVWEAFAAAIVLAAVPNLLAAAGLSLRVGPAVVGALFVYLPGRAIVSAVIDGLANAPVSAVARGIQALATVVSLALGMLVGTELGVGLGLKYQPNLHETPLLLSVLGAGAGVFGLATAWGMPRQLVPPTAVIGAGAWLCFTLTATQGNPTDWAAYGLAAGIVGLSAVIVSLFRKAAASVYTGVAILPLVPGFILYTGVLAVSQGHSAAALTAFGRAGIISLSIAVGLAIGLAVSHDVLSVRERLTLGRHH